MLRSRLVSGVVLLSGGSRLTQSQIGFANRDQGRASVAPAGAWGAIEVPGPLARPEPRRLPTRLCENAATAASVPQSLLQKVRQFGDISSDLRADVGRNPSGLILREHFGRYLRPLSSSK